MTNAHQREILCGLSGALRDSGFDASSIDAARSVENARSDWELRQVELRLIMEDREESPLSLLLALFALRFAVSRERLEKVVPGLDVHGLLELGVLERNRDEVRALVRMSEVGGLLSPPTGTWSTLSRFPE